MEGGTDFLGLHDGTARTGLQLIRSVVPDYDLDTAKKLYDFFDNLCHALPELMHPVDVWEVLPGKPPKKRF